MNKVKDTVSAIWHNEKPALVLLAIAAVLFAVFRSFLAPVKQEAGPGENYAEYEKGRVLEVLSDTTEMDESSDNAWRGEQLLSVEILSGQYKGETLLVNNYVGPLYGVPMSAGDGVSVIINTYSSGELRATVYEYNRIPALLGILLIFFVITILIGGKTGLKSLISLAVTVAVLFLILIPWLLKGAPTLPAVFAVCLYITVVAFTIIGGVHRKTVCAMLGTAAGTVFALLFAAAAQYFTRISGLRTSDVEPLLQLRQTGIPIGLKGLLTAGIVISSLGAVMDVAMSISSALEEVHNANPDLSAKELFGSGMNIGRDMVGTMTNTLILAFLGSGFTLIIYLYSLGLSKYQLYTSAYASIEVISGIASSAGMILAIPLTALISSYMLKR